MLTLLRASTLALTIPVAAQAGPVVIANLGGQCGPGTLTATTAFFSIDITYTATGLGIPVLVLGVTDPAFPIPGCAPCVAHASLDVTVLMLGSPTYTVAIPSGLPPGTTFYAQGFEIVMGGFCTSLGPELDITDGLSFTI